MSDWRQWRAGVLEETLKLGMDDEQAVADAEGGAACNHIAVVLRCGEVSLSYNVPDRLYDLPE